MKNLTILFAVLLAISLLFVACSKQTEKYVYTPKPESYIKFEDVTITEKAGMQEVSGNVANYSNEVQSITIRIVFFDEADNVLKDSEIDVADIPANGKKEFWAYCVVRNYNRYEIKLD